MNGRSGFGVPSGSYDSQRETKNKSFSKSQIGTSEKAREGTFIKYYLTVLFQVVFFYFNISFSNWTSLNT